MFAEENKARLLKALEHFNGTDNREAYFDFYAPDVVFHGFPPGLPPGVAGLRAFYAMAWVAYPDGQLHVDDIVGEGNRVAVRVNVTATHQGEFMGVPPAGKAITLQAITILRFAEGKCVERWQQADNLGLLQQLGAIPG